MNFLIPCDDIINDIANKHEALSINPSLIIIGYQETQWSHNTPIHERNFQQFQSLLLNDDNITIDNISYIKYTDIYLWHKSNKIDRMNGSGNTTKSEQWDTIKNKYTHHLKSNQTTNDDEKSIDKPKGNRVTLNIDRNPEPLVGQKVKGGDYYRRYYYNRYWWNNYNPATDIIDNGYYEITDKLSGNSTKINIEKYLKKSYKKTKLYHADNHFKFLTANQLDSIYRNYENMEINIINCSSLNALYRIQADKNKTFKKICVLNVYGGDNNFNRKSTINHSLNRYSYNLWSDSSDEASKYLYTNTMVYSPNCVIFDDLNGEKTASYFKVSFLTVYPVNAKEYYRIKRRIFDEPEMAEKFKKLDEKLTNNGQQKSKKGVNKHKNNNKSKKRTDEEIAEFMAKINEMKDEIAGIMRDRIRRMIEIAIYNGCDAVVFDAFGCDEECGNDVREIAAIFTEFMKNIYFNCFKSVTFTILDEKQNGNQRNRVHAKKKEDKDMISTFKIFQESFESKFS